MNIPIRTPTSLAAATGLANRIALSLAAPSPPPSPFETHRNSRSQTGSAGEGEERSRPEISGGQHGLLEAKEDKKAAEPLEEGRRLEMPD